jgi:threonine/homoserine/homoserine lactone efflux protein
MPDTSLIIAFLLAAIPSYFTPGPNNLLLMTSAAKFGFRRTIPHGAGISLGFPLMVFVLGLGLGEVFTAFPQIKTILKFAAAAYFLWMAWTLLGLKIGSAGGRQRPMQFHEAVLFQWVNPKAWAMGSAFVALVVVPGEARIESLVWLTLGCLLLAPLSTSLWMVFGNQLQAILRKTGTERYLGWILAALMLAAVVLFLL